MSKTFQRNAKHGNKASKIMISAENLVKNSYQNLSKENWKVKSGQNTHELTLNIHISNNSNADMKSVS